MAQTTQPATSSHTAPEFAGTSNDPTIQPMNSLTKFSLYYTPSYLNATLHLGDISSPAHYYMQSKSMRLNPTMLIRRGADKHAPVVAFAKAKYTSRHMTIGLGDCEDKHNADACSVEELTRDKNMFRRSDYRFSVESKDGGGSPKKREFVWAKDRHVQRSSVYNCLDEDGNVVGRMLSGGMFNLMKGAEVHVDQTGLDLGTQELLIAGAFAVWAFEALSYRSPLRGYPKGSEAEKVKAN